MSLEEQGNNVPDDLVVSKACVYGSTGARNIVRRSFLEYLMQNVVYCMIY
jgi:hypothetical protein